MSDPRPTVNPMHSSPETAPDHTAEPDPNGLSLRDKDILAFEHGWWKYQGAKEQAMLDLFGLSATRYYQVLHAIIDRPEALEHDPMVVKRLQRLRGTRRTQRGSA